MSRLEEIKARQKDGTYLLDKTMIRADWDWLVEQVDENSKKHAILNVFLQERDPASTLETHVIDAAIKYIQELEGFMDKADESLVKSGRQIIKLTDEKAELDYQNKRYREAIKKAIGYFEDECLRDALTTLRSLGCDEG